MGPKTTCVVFGGFAPLAMSRRDPQANNANPGSVLRHGGTPIVPKDGGVASFLFYLIIRGNFKVVNNVFC